MFTIVHTTLFIIVGLIVTSSGAYIAYERCKRQKIKYPVRISAVLFITIAFISGYLAKTELLNYLTNTIFTTPESTVNVFSFYIILILTGLYIVFVLITEDLLKNLSIFLNFFENLIRR